MTPQDKGREFEKYIHEQILSKIEYPIFSEAEICNKYGSNNKGIDHLIETADSIICIQDKHVNSKIPLDKINHFITCVNNVSNKSGKKAIGLYISLEGITKPSQNSFDDQNEKGYNYFVSIFNNNEIKLFQKLKDFLYYHKIYMYDNDGSAIMLDEYEY
jgi:hypothetical protein